MASQTNFNPDPPGVMHIDLNSAFASIEQQANPLLRGKPIAVVAYDSPGGCILASSIEAKALGIKTGHRVRDAKALYPKLITLPSDPNKYRAVHLAFRKILADYTNDFYPKSIDEFVLHFKNYHTFDHGLKNIAREIKHRIQAEIGDHLTVSVGIGPNRFLAKTASNLKKPDGLEEITKENFLNVYGRLKLTDLTGINLRYEARLRNAHIHSVVDLYSATPQKLKTAFHSILANYWYHWLRGYEAYPSDNQVRNLEFARKSFGNSYSLPHSIGTKEEIFPLLQKLVEKTGLRLRSNGYKATGVHLALRYRDHTFWHQSKSFQKSLFGSLEIYREMIKLLYKAPLKPVHTIHESCFGLISNKETQLDLFENVIEKENLIDSLDQINSRWGSFVITPARMILVKDKIPERIAFGGIRELSSNE